MRDRQSLDAWAEAHPPPGPPPAAWSLELPFDIDLALNANHRPHWTEARRRTRYWRRLAAAEALDARCPHFARAAITITYAWPTRRRRDVGNLQPTSKAIVDGLVDAGLLPDDDDTRIVGPDNRRAIGPHTIRIDVTNLEGRARRR